VTGPFADAERRNRGLPRRGAMLSGRGEKSSENRRAVRPCSNKAPRGRVKGGEQGVLWYLLERERVKSPASG